MSATLMSSSLGDKLLRAVLPYFFGFWFWWNEGEGVPQVVDLSELLMRELPYDYMNFTSFSLVKKA